MSPPDPLEAPEPPHPALGKAEGRPLPGGEGMGSLPPPGTPTLWILLAANIIIFLLEMAAAGPAGMASGPLGSGIAADRLIRFGGLHRLLVVEEGETWRLLAAPFLHLSWLDIVLDIIFLWLVGRAAARLAGEASFALVYALSALAGEGAMLWAYPDAITVGPTGAISGLVGALLAIRLREGSRLGPDARRGLLLGLLGRAGALILMSLFFNLAIASAGQPVAWNPAPLIAGLAAGFLLGFVLPNRVRDAAFPGSGDLARFFAAAIAVLILAPGAVLALGHVARVGRPDRGPAGDSATLVDLPRRAYRDSTAGFELEVPFHWLPPRVEEGHTTFGQGAITVTVGDRPQFFAPMRLPDIVSYQADVLAREGSPPRQILRVDEDLGMEGLEAAAIYNAYEMDGVRCEQAVVVVVRGDLLAFLVFNYMSGDESFRALVRAIAATFRFVERPGGGEPPAR